MELLTGGRKKHENVTCVVGVVYATWCPHCTTLVGHNENEESDWSRVKLMLDNANHKGTSYLVEKTESEEKSKLNELRSKGIVANGFPTIYKYYIKSPGDKATGLEYYSNGPRNDRSIFKWASNHSNRFGNGFKYSGGSKRRVRKTTKRRRKGCATRRR